MRKDATTKDLDTLHKQAKASRSKLDRIWILNLAYVRNEQWSAVDSSGRLYRPQMPAHRVTVVDNRILPCVNTEIAKMTKNRPIFTVVPRSGDEEDRNAAELGEQVMRYLWKDLSMHEKVTEALRWSRVTGAGFLKCYWDPTVGSKVEVLMDSSNSILTHQDGSIMTPQAIQGMPAEMTQGIVVKEICQGDLRVESRSPFQVFVDPLADSFPEAEWLIEESVKSADYVYQRYGVTIEPDTDANPSLIEARFMSDQRSGAYKGVKIREYWSKPNKQHPQGYRAVWAKDKFLVQDEQPFDPMPYVMLRGIPVPGQLWPTSIVEQLIGPQTELNKVKSQIAENRNRIGNPTGVASKQAVQDPEKFLDSISQAGGWYFFDDIGSPNSVPSYLQTPQLPAYVVEQIQVIEESIQEISGQHEVASAQVPPGVTAASAINLLMEADDTRLGPQITDFEVQLGRLGQKLLQLAARYFTDARTIKIGGENANWEIVDFRGTMLRDNTQVEVQAGSSFPTSKAAKQAAMQDLLTYMVQSGNPIHGRQLAQFLSDWEVGGVDALVEEYTKNETQINRENLLLSQGIPQDINSYDDDQDHIVGHTDYQKGSHYTQLDPNTKQIFEYHVAAHRMRVQQAQEQVMNAQLAAQGQGPQQLQLEGLQQAQGLAQGAQQMQGAAQQQGYDQASAEQNQRQAAEQHQQQMQHRDELHQQKLHQNEQRHQAQLQQQRKAA